MLTKSASSLTLGTAAAFLIASAGLSTAETLTLECSAYGLAQYVWDGAVTIAPPAPIKGAPPPNTLTQNWSNPFFLRATYTLDFAANTVTGPGSSPGSTVSMKLVDNGAGSSTYVFQSAVPSLNTPNPARLTVWIDRVTAAFVLREEQLDATAVKILLTDMFYGTCGNKAKVQF